MVNRGLKSGRRRLRSDARLVAGVASLMWGDHGILAGVKIESRDRFEILAKVIGLAQEHAPRRQPNFVEIDVGTGDTVAAPGLRQHIPIWIEYAAGTRTIPSGIRCIRRMLREIGLDDEQAVVDRARS